MERAIISETDRSARKKERMEREMMISETDRSARREEYFIIDGDTGEIYVNRVRSDNPLVNRVFDDIRENTLTYRFSRVMGLRDGMLYAYHACLDLEYFDQARNEDFVDYEPGYPLMTNDNIKFFGERYVLIGDHADENALYRIDYETPDGNNVLMIATAANDLDTVNILLHQKDFDVNHENKKGENALHIAVIHENIEMVKLLLLEGIDYDKQDNRGNTPLIRATHQNLIDIVNVLISNKADAEIENNQGFSALKIALFGGIAFSAVLVAIGLYVWYQSSPEDIVRATYETAEIGRKLVLLGDGRYYDYRALLNYQTDLTLGREIMAMKVVQPNPSDVLPEFIIKAFDNFSNLEYIELFRGIAIPLSRSGYIKTRSIYPVVHLLAEKVGLGTDSLFRLAREYLDDAIFIL